MEQLPCWITRTTPETHRIIHDELGEIGAVFRSDSRNWPAILPIDRGQGRQVRRIESSHQIFLEPEGKHTEEFYVNGVSTSLPYDVQLAFLKTIPGLDDVEVLRPGYAVEYDYFPPTQLHHTLGD